MKRFTSIYVALSFSMLGAMHASEAKPPNILVLLADDWGYLSDFHWVGQGIKTPVFDRIAKEGVVFRNAHAAAPSCSPSRAAILSGQWPWRLEQGGNLHGFIPAKFEVYPDRLKSAGYFIGMAGKGYGPGTDKGRSHNAAGPAFKDFDAFLSARPEGRPFCFWFGSHQPHRPYQSGSGIKSGIDVQRQLKIPLAKIKTAH